MPEVLKLNITFSEYWHAGTGITGGNHLDALVQKDADKLPLLNGRHIKGLLRQAVRLNEEWGALKAMQLPACADQQAKSWETYLFGAINQSLTSDSTFAGIVCVSDACLSAAEKAFIKEHQYINQLYRTLYSTAIEESGVAKEKSLRAIEVAVPMTLGCELELLSQEDSASGGRNVRDVIEQSLPLIRYAGGGRTRGLGRVSVTIQGGASS